MYVVNKKTKKKISAIPIAIIFLMVAVMLVGAFWYVFLRDNSSSSASFVKRDVKDDNSFKVKTKTITTEYFKINLPLTWENNGRLNPFSNQVYYELQDKNPKSDSKYLRIYVDVYPKDYPVNEVLLISNDGARLISAESSGDCTTLPGAPKHQAGTSIDSWATNYKGIKFTCDIANPYSQVGAISEELGYGQRMKGASGTTHEYFFVYIDRSSRPDSTIFSDAINSFQSL